MSFFKSLLSLDYFGADVLTTLTFLPTLGAVILLFVSEEAKKTIRVVGLATSGAVLALSAVMAVRFDATLPGISNFLVDRPWLPRFGLRYLLGIDGLGHQADAAGDVFDRRRDLHDVVDRHLGRTLDLLDLAGDLVGGPVDLLGPAQRGRRLPARR